MAHSSYFPIKRNNKDSCTYNTCVNQIPIKKSEQVRDGDHIILRSMRCDHHLIVVEIHNSDSHGVQVTAIHSYPDRENSKSLHREGKNIPLDGSAFVVSYKSPMFSRDEIVRRANQRLTSNESGGGNRYEYNLITRNCEHFANWCVTNSYFSAQVVQFHTIFGFMHAPTLKTMHDQEKLCDSCYEGLLQTVLSVPWKHVPPNDVNKGDIVSYSYYMLWHDAVVMEVKSDNKLVLAHYGVESLFHPRKIKKETVGFEGNKTLTVYNYDGWNVHSPDEVVARAKSRIAQNEMQGDWREGRPTFVRSRTLPVLKSEREFHSQLTARSRTGRRSSLLHRRSQSPLDIKPYQASASERLKTPDFSALVRKKNPIPQLLDHVDENQEFPVKSIQEWKNQVTKIVPKRTAIAIAMDWQAPPAEWDDREHYIYSPKPMFTKTRSLFPKEIL